MRKLQTHQIKPRINNLTAHTLTYSIQRDTETQVRTEEQSEKGTKTQTGMQ